MPPARPLPVLLLVALAVAPTALATHADGGRGTGALGGATVPHSSDLVTLEAEDFPEHESGKLVADSSASGGKAWEFPTYGWMNTTFDTSTTGTLWFRIYANGSHPANVKNPHLHLYVDGMERAEADVRGEWGPYFRSLPLVAGHHTLRIENFNNYRDAGTGPTSQRVLRVDRVVIEAPTLDGAPRVGAAATAGAPVVVPSAEIHSALTGTLVTTSEALSGSMWWEWGIGCLAETWVAESASDVVAKIRANGTMVNGEATHVVIRQDVRVVDDYFQDATWGEHETHLDGVAPGAHVLEVCYDNDRQGEKRDLWLDQIAFTMTRANSTVTPPPVETTPSTTPTSSTTPSASTPTTPNESTGAPSTPPGRIPAPGAAFVAVAAALCALALRPSRRP